MGPVTPENNQSTPKPRFFVPQPVHVDYMNALDNLRASRSPTATPSTSGTDVVRPPTSKHKIYEAAKDLLPPDSAFFSSGGYPVKEKQGSKPLIFKQQKMKRHPVSADAEILSPKRQHGDVPAPNNAGDASPQQSLHSLKVNRRQNEKCSATKEPSDLQPPHKKRKSMIPSQSLTVFPARFEAEDGSLTAPNSADSASGVVDPPTAECFPVQSHSIGGTIGFMPSTDAHFHSGNHAVGYLPLPVASSFHNPAELPSVSANPQYTMHYSPQQSFQSGPIPVYTSSPSTSISAAMPPDASFCMSHPPSSEIQDSLREFSGAYEDEHPASSQHHTFPNSFGHGYAGQDHSPMQAWNDNYNYMRSQDVTTDEFGNHGYSTEHTYAPFDGSSSPVVSVHRPLPYQHIQHSENTLLSEEVQQETYWPNSHSKVPKAHIIRGLSPERPSMLITSEASFNQLGTQFSQPTVPEYSDFQFSPSATGPQRTSSDQAQNQRSRIGKTSSSLTNHEGFLERKSLESGESILDSQTVTDQSHDNFLLDHSTENIPLGSPGCDVPCDGDCDSVDCTTCDSSQICCEPCTNPELCSSGDCDDPRCFDEPNTICTGHHTPAGICPTRDAPASPETSYVNPTELTLKCQWETSGQQCEASMFSFNSLSQHVLQTHIQPQSVLPCQWNHCSDQVEVDNIPNHVWHYHSPTSKADAYVCLWQGCGNSFLTTDDLEVHMKATHCRMNCHWNGCEQATSSEIALKAHVDTKHITKALNHYAISATPSLYSPETPQTAPYADEALDTILDFKSRAPQVTGSAGDAAPNGTTNAGEKTCLWEEHGAFKICGKTFANGNELQAHVEECHVPNLKAITPPNPKPLESVYSCYWQGCKNKARFFERSKLARHLYTHTRYMIGVCVHCGKEFNNQNQLGDHERTHTKERPFTCETCGYHATNKAALTTHMRTHTGEKPLRCDRCSYTCGDPSNMSKHRKTHEAPLYKCELCEKAFCRMSTLKRHLLSHGAGKQRGCKPSSSG